MLRPIAQLPLILALSVSPALLVGCGDDKHQPAAESAEKALGINPDPQKKTSTVTKDVTEIKETKVIDNATGQVISDKKEVTPVKIKEETNVNKDVKVEVGDTKTTGK